MVELYEQTPESISNTSSEEVQQDTCEQTASILEIKQRIIEELRNPGFPDLKYLFSPRALRCAHEVLDDLLREEIEQFNLMLEMSPQEITYDDLYPPSILKEYIFLLSNCRSLRNDSEIREVWRRTELSYGKFQDRKEYLQLFYRRHIACINNSSTTDEQKLVLERRIQEFEQRGIHLNRKRRNLLKTIEGSIKSYKALYGNNLIDGKKRIEHIFPNDDSISEMPEYEKSIARKKAQAQGKEGYLFDETPSSVLAITKYCSDREVRRLFFVTIYQSANSGKHNNIRVLLNILKLRQKKARILGHRSYAELSFANGRMIETPGDVQNMLREVHQRARSVGESRAKELMAFFHLDEMELYDIDYYTRKFRDIHYGIDTQNFQQYFEFENVLRSMFDIAEILFGIQIVEMNISTYHEDVKVYKVSKDGEILAYFVGDYFYRELKRGGACSTFLRTAGSGNTKIIINIANFHKSEEGNTFLDFSEIEVLFHEFGHALHNILSSSQLHELSGNSVEQDFVEFPSKLFENWGRHKDTLSLMSFKGEAQQTLQEDQIAALDASSKLDKWRDIMASIQLSSLDLKLHSQGYPTTPEEFKRMLEDNFHEISFFPMPAEYRERTNFPHIITGRYATGYYSYLWAEILEKDIWSTFLHSGNIFDPDISQRLLENVLSVGSQKSGREMFYNVQGREPDIDHFLESELS